MANRPAPPNSRELEARLLGAIVEWPRLFREVVDIIKSEDFWSKEHRCVFEKMVELYGRGIEPSWLVLMDSFKDGPIREYVRALTEVMPCSPEGARGVAKKLKEYSLRRNALSYAGELAELAYKETPIATLIEKTEEKATEWAKGIGRAVTFYTMDSLAWGFTTMLERWIAGERDFLPTGFAVMDKMGGFKPSDLILLAGRPAMGKTSCALSIAVRVAKQGHRVYFASLEQGPSGISSRIFSQLSGVSAFDAEMGRSTSFDYDKMKQAVSDHHNLPIVFDFQALMRSTELVSRVREADAISPVDLVIIDYLGLFADVHEGENIVHNIGKITKTLKGLARELQVPVMALHQLSRDVEKRQSKVPILADLRDCLVGGTLVYDGETGQRLPIERVVEGSGVVTWGKDFNLVSRGVVGAWATGDKPVCRLTTRTGREIVASANHRFLIHRSRLDRSWRPLSEIKPGDRIVVPRRYPPTGKNTLTKAQAVLLGWILGDGWIGNYRVELTVASEKEARLAKCLADKAWGLTAQIYPGRKDSLRVGMSVRQGRVGKGENRLPNPLVRWFKEQGLTGKVAADKFVPPEIFMQSPDIIGAFLRGLFHADGTAPKRPEKKGIGLKFSSVSEQLARDVLHLLVRLGVVGRLYKTSMKVAGFRTANQYMWEVNIGGYQEVNKFVAYSGFLLDKNVAFRKRCRFPGLYMAKSIAKNGMYFFDEVKEIEFLGVRPTYDLEVDGPPFFCANDILVHNSGNLEQDADMVIFLHRAAYYDKEGKHDQSGVCDVIYAKHRNGPTGRVRLFFNAPLTSFFDLEHETHAKDS